MMALSRATSTACVIYFYSWIIVGEAPPSSAPPWM
jgi:hypothetical protein